MEYEMVGVIGAGVMGTGVAQNLAQVTRYLASVSASTPQPEVHLKPHRLAKYDTVAKILAIAQRLGVGLVSRVESTRGFGDRQDVQVEFVGDGLERRQPLRGMRVSREEQSAGLVHGQEQGCTLS